MQKGDLPGTLGEREGSCWEESLLPWYRATYPPWYIHTLPPSGYTDHPAHPCRTAAAVTGRCTLAALTREVAELNIRKGRVTVTGVTDHPFHCWSLLRVMPMMRIVPPHSLGE